MKLIERFLKRSFERRGNVVEFRIDHVSLPNGKKAVREYLDHPGAVAVVPVLDRNHILMVEQYRYPVGQVTWEIPAGKLDHREAPLTCVKRELEEETGYKAGKLTKLLSYWPTAAFANELIHIYVATHLKPGTANPDSDEFLNCRPWRIKDVLAAIRSGRIKDSKTMIALLAYHTM